MIVDLNILREFVRKQIYRPFDVSYDAFTNTVIILDSPMKVKSPKSVFRSVLKPLRIVTNIIPLQKCEGLHLLCGNTVIPH